MRFSSSFNFQSKKYQGKRERSCYGHQTQSSNNFFSGTTIGWCKLVHFWLAPSPAGDVLWCSNASKTWTSFHFLVSTLIRPNARGLFKFLWRLLDTMSNRLKSTRLQSIRLQSIRLLVKSSTINSFQSNRQLNLSTWLVYIEKILLIGGSAP